MFHFIMHVEELIKWISWCFNNIETFPVESQVNPGDILKTISDYPPTEPENFKHVFEEFVQNIIPGITHWQSPNFFVYLPANSSIPC